MLGVQARARGLAVDLAVDDAVPEALEGDVTRLRQVLVNLVHNAIKFTDEGRVSVTVAGRSMSGGLFEIDVRVTDTGIGIAPEEVERLFEAFVQQDSSTTRKYGGTGLGLSISQRLVQLMGGAIEVASEPGAGTTFTVRLPLPVAITCRRCCRSLGSWHQASLSAKVRTRALHSDISSSTGSTTSWSAHSTQRRNMP